MAIDSTNSLGTGNLSLQKAGESQVDDVMRAMPHALGPEKSILSSMLQNPLEYVSTAIEEKLTKEHFYLPAHGIIFELLLEFFEKGMQVEVVALVQKLIDKNLLESVGGPAAITELYSYAPNAAHFLTHLNFVKDKHTLRSIIHSCNEAITNAYDNPEDVPQLLDTVETNVLAIRENAEVNRAITTSLAVKDVMEQFAQLCSSERKAQGILTGYDKLDEMCGGLKPGEMFIIAARPSMGKTSFMMNIVEHICIDQKKPSMVFSCEMTTTQIVQRLLFSRARYRLSDLTKGITPSKKDLLNIRRASEEITNAKLFIDDTAGISINDLRAKARRKKRDEDIQMIAVDYLQLMRSLSKQAANSREREVAEISSGLKALAKELSIPVIVLAQLNRGPEGRTGSKPRMSDLRESGSIEQDADLVGLLYRSAYYANDNEERKEEEGVADLNLAKNRNGETGDIPLTFIAPLMRFESGHPAQEPGAA
ncbi:MAG: replicative DNA helicase [Verrucomicrobia bacterium]|jgi:replicative DNA helicase|nr:MAG: replicative DNA helicase [Verrucomicrobiota bacterium]